MENKNPIFSKTLDSKTSTVSRLRLSPDVLRFSSIIPSQWLQRLSGILVPNAFSHALLKSTGAVEDRNPLISQSPILSMRMTQPLSQLVLGGDPWPPLLERRSNLLFFNYYLYVFSEVMNFHFWRL